MTANSVPAYASRMAIITKDGVKRTWPSRLPDVIIADLKILSEAPLEYTMGGIGDMCAMFMAFADWYLGNYFGIGSYFHGSWYILEDVKELMFAYAGEINQRTLLGMEVLAKIETLGGLSMTYARESAPLSGFEHVVSHMLDMGAPFWGRRIANHGSQVAVAAIPGLIGLNRFLDDFDPRKVNLDACYPSTEAMERRVRGTFDALDVSGAMGAECWSDYRQKLKGWVDARARCEEFLADWENQRSHLRSLIMGVEPYVQALAAARHPLLFEELNVSVPRTAGALGLSQCPPDAQAVQPRAISSTISVGSQNPGRTVCSPVCINSSMKQGGNRRRSRLFDCGHRGWRILLAHLAADGGRGDDLLVRPLRSRGEGGAGSV